MIEPFEELERVSQRFAPLVLMLHNFQLFGEQREFYSHLEMQGSLRTHWVKFEE